MPASTSSAIIVPGIYVIYAFTSLAEPLRMFSGCPTICPFICLLPKFLTRYFLQTSEPVCKQVNRFQCKLNRVSISLGNSGLCWTIFARNSDTAVPAEGNGDLQTLICVLVARPRRCLTLSNTVPRQNWMAAYLGYTVRMKTLFRGWPVVAHEMHTRRSGSANWHRWSTGQGHERSTFGVRRSVWVIQHQNRSQKNLFCEDLLRTVLGVVLTKSGSR